MPIPPDPAVGQIWSDKDPRGGPMFHIVAIDDEHAIVENVHGYRRRRKILLRRFDRYRLEDGQ